MLQSKLKFEKKFQVFIGSLTVNTSANVLHQDCVGVVWSEFLRDMRDNMRKQLHNPPHLSEADSNTA